MRRRLLLAALLSTTALTPEPARAGPVVAAVAQFVAGAIPGAGPILAGGSVLGGTAGAVSFAYGVGASNLLFGTVVGQFVVAYGLSALSRALMPRPRVPSPSERFVNFAQAIAPMESVFGRVRKGGPYALSVFRVDRRHYAVILAAHQIDGIEQLYLDERSVELDEIGFVATPPYSSDYVGVRYYLGTDTQPADTALIDNIPEWTAAHDMRGLAYIALFAKRPPYDKFSELYGNSPPTGPAATVAMRGALVYDPRTGRTEYSNNAALVWAWLTTNRLGQSVDWDDVAIEADACDVLVTNRDGQSQRKWTLNGVFTDDTDYADLYDQIIAACDGYVYERPNGTLGLKVGRYIAPTITLDEACFYSLTVAENDWGAAPPTEFVGRYVEPDYDWYESNTAVWVEDADAVPVRRQPTLAYVDSHNQAMRCVKRAARASRPQYTVQASVGPIAYELLDGHRFVRIQAYGYDFVCEIARLSRSADSVIAFELQGASVEPEDFEFVAATEEPERPPRETLTGSDVIAEVATLSGAAVEGGGIQWSWPEQPPETAQQLEFREAGAATWQPVSIISDGATAFTSLGLVNGTAYEARIRNRTSAGRSGAWTESASVVATTNLTPPAPPPVFSAEVTGDTVALTWTAPNDENYAGTRLLRAAGSTDIGDAETLPVVYGTANTVGTYIDAGLSPQAYVYWALSVNSSGIVSETFAGPEMVEVVE